MLLLLTAWCRLGLFGDEVVSAFKLIPTGLVDVCSLKMEPRVTMTSAHHCE
jgi:hypothetical protein